MYTHVQKMLVSRVYQERLVFYYLKYNIKRTPSMGQMDS